MKFDCVERLVSRAFLYLGHTVGRRPKIFIIVPLLLTGFSLLGVLKLKYVSDPEYLFSPSDGPGRDERQYVETYFPMNYSTEFDVGRMSRVSPLVRLFLEAKGNKSIFDKEVFADMKRIDEMIRNVTVVWNDTVWTYEDMCAKKNRRCFENQILNYEDRLDDMARGRYSIKYPLVVDERTFEIFFSAAFLGGVETNDQSMIVSAKAVTLLFFLDESKVGRDFAWHWERIVMRMIKEENEQNLKHVTVTYHASQTLEKELNMVTIAVLPLASIMAIGMLCFSITASLMLDWVRSKPWLGVLGCVSASLSVVAGFGFAMLFGVELINLNISAPFLMLGIGMDNTFLLLAAWRRTDRKLSVEERVAGAYSDAGASITITSLTNFVSFCVGITTPFPSIRIFCIYTALCVVFMYAFQITFFGACMAVTGYSEQKNMHGLLCFQAVPKSLSTHRGLCYRMLCTGGINPEDPDNKMDNKENFLMKIFRDKVGTALTCKSVQIVTVILFLTYIGFGIWGCTVINEGLERFNMARYDSYSIQYYQMEDKYFRKYPYRIQVMINKTLDYSDPKVQQEVENVIQRFENSKFMAGSRFTESWLRIYKSFLNDSRAQSFLSGYNMSRKEDFYEAIPNVFFRLSRNYFKPDIKFNSDFSEITASRFVLQSANILTVNDEKDMLIDLRAIAESSSLPVTVFSQLFVYFDQFLRVRQTAMQSIGVATVVMIFITFIFIPIPSCALWVAFSIFSIEIGVVGYMSWWNVNLDAVSMITVILCIGFSVDYSAHIAYTYVTAEENDPDDKLKRALHSVGLPIVQGSISTFIGIIMLVFANSYICNVFFKTVFLVIFFGALHGLFLLPIALRLTDICWRNFKTPKKCEDESVPPSSYYTKTIIAEKLNGKDSWGQGIGFGFNKEMETKSEVESCDGRSETESGIEHEVTNDQTSTDNDRNSTDNENCHVNKGFVDDDVNKELP